MRLSVTTPVGSLVDAEVEEITAPGVLGEMGILPGHVPLLSALAPGVLTYRGKQSGVIAVGTGFVEVVPGEGGGRILVIVDEGVPGAQVNRPEVEQELSGLDAQLTAWKGETGGEYEATRRRRAWAQARVDAAARANAH